MKFLEPTRKPKVMYTDNSLEFGKSFEELSWNHCTSTPHRSETNVIAERAGRRVKEGTSAVLLQSFLDNEWWTDFMEYHCDLRNFQDLLSDGKTPYERRFGIPFKGPVTPFGAMVEYHTSSAKDLWRLHQFGPKVLPCIFLGYALDAGGTWKGDILIADTEELEQMDASEIHFRRLIAKEVLTPMKGEQFYLPCRRWNSQNPWRRLTSENIDLNSGSSRTRRRTINSSSRIGRTPSPSPHQDDSTQDDAEAKNDFWSTSGDFIYRHHVEPRVKLNMPKEDSILIPLKYIDVTRTTHTRHLMCCYRKILMTTGT